MAIATTTFPKFEQPLQTLVAQHRKLKERLILAVYFDPQSTPTSDVCLFEILEGFGPDEPAPDDDDLFQFSYGNTPGFRLPEGVNLRMVLTNPSEWKKAVADNWKAAAELRAAKQAKEFVVLYADPTGKKLWDALK